MAGGVSELRRTLGSVLRRARDGGCVLFHASSAIEGVRDFTRELLARGLAGVDLDSCNGLFVLHKRGTAIW